MHLCFAFIWWDRMCNSISTGKTGIKNEFPRVNVYLKRRMTKLNAFLYRKYVRCFVAPDITGSCHVNDSKIPPRKPWTSNAPKLSRGWIENVDCRALVSGYDKGKMESVRIVQMKMSETGIWISPKDTFASPEPVRKKNSVSQEIVRISNRLLFFCGLQPETSNICINKVIMDDIGANIFILESYFILPKNGKVTRTYDSMMK